VGRALLLLRGDRLGDRALGLPVPSEPGPVRRAPAQSSAIADVVRVSGIVVYTASDAAMQRVTYQ
jgi:hypothetical protein